MFGTKMNSIDFEDKMSRRDQKLSK